MVALFINDNKDLDHIEREGIKVVKSKGWDWENVTQSSWLKPTDCSKVTTKEIDFCHAAFSQIDITPDFQTSLVGCYRPDSRSQGVLHRLYAQVLLFQTGNKNFCLIAIDNLGLTVLLSNLLRSKIAAELNTDISHVMLNFSHTHSAPEPTPLAVNGERYFEFLCKQIVTCVKIAKKTFTPCKVGWALATSDIGDNRRDGCTITDNRLGALMVADAESGKTIVIVTRIAAHANVLMCENLKISSDYIGIAREELQVFYGCPIMVLQGASGNIKPIGVDKIGGGNLDDLHRVANIFINDAKKLHFELEDIEDILMFSKEMVFISDVPSKEEAEKIVADSGIEAEDWLLSCEELRNKGDKTQSLKAEVNFFKLNQGCICGIAEEIFCELALDVQERTGNPLLFLNGYTNGCTGYLPSHAEWYKGGYEVYESYFYYHKYHGHIMPYRAETADQITDLVVSEWERVKM